MKKLASKSFPLLSIFCAIMLISPSCATIVGGAQYRAYIEVDGYSNAEIRYQGMSVGNGSANFKVKRRNADILSITVREDGCMEQTFTYDGHKFRGFTFVVSVLLWSSFVAVPPYIIPWGIALDGITGAWWKPDHIHPDITKIDYDNFHYKINYTGCGEEDYERGRSGDEDDYY